MSMSMNLHTKTAENFEVKAKLTSVDYGSEKYPVIKLKLHLKDLMIIKKYPFSLVSNK
jgi:hypothetical protein